MVAQHPPITRLRSRFVRWFRHIIGIDQARPVPSAPPVTTIFLEMSVGNIEAAVAVSLIMVVAAVVVLIIARLFGLRGSGLI